ncbi:helix-turn-helix DNA binding domain protein [Streptomyces phage Dennebes]|nr:helix-turn-helix DNA binding domain protein [Streptomyces phage Dennebes]
MSNMIELDYDIMTKMVRDVARSVSSSFPQYVTSEDTEGHLWVWVYEKKSQIQKAVEDGPQWEAKIASTLRKVASDYCAREKAAVEGYSVEDLYRYTIPKIKSLLPDIFEYQDWQSFGLKGDGQPSSKPQANQTGDRIAELVDIRAAVKALPEETKELLYLLHVYNYTAENLAEYFDISLEAAKKRMQRAYGAVQRSLGRRDPGAEPSPADRRTVRSNAAWRASQGAQYEG